MAVMRDRPVLNSNFLVDFGHGKAHDQHEGFAEVVFPEFHLAAPAAREMEATHETTEPKPACAANRLILKRGVCGGLDLYAWWHKERSVKAPRRRSLKIHLLSEDHETIVLTWHFHKVRPVTLSYSPLRAQEGVVVLETIELAFESFEMS